jgi:hypothetical protein
MRAGKVVRVERDQAVAEATRRWMRVTGEPYEQARRRVEGTLAGQQLLLAVLTEAFAGELRRHWLGRLVAGVVGRVVGWGVADPEAGPGRVAATEERPDLVDRAHPARVVGRVEVVAGTGGGWWWVARVTVGVDRSGDPGQLGQPVDHTGQELGAVVPPEAAANRPIRGEPTDQDQQPPGPNRGRAVADGGEV